MKVWDDSSPYDFNWSPQKFRRLAAEHDERARRARADGDIDDASREARKAIDCRQTARGKEWLDDPSPPATPAPEPAAAPAVGEAFTPRALVLRLEQDLRSRGDDATDPGRGAALHEAAEFVHALASHPALATPRPAAQAVTAEMVEAAKGPRFSQRDILCPTARTSDRALGGTKHGTPPSSPPSRPGRRAGMKKHRLKTHATAWDAIADGRKTFEVRKNDRFFQSGDTVELIYQEQESPYWLDDTRVIRKRIGWMLQGGQFGIEPGYCVFALEPIEEPAP